MLAGEAKRLNTISTSSIFLSISLLCLSAALVYLTWQLGQISLQIPVILESVEKTSEKIEPVIKQVNELQQSIKPVLNEVVEIRKQTPFILNEVKQTRLQIPAILDSTNKMSQALVMTSNEVKATRPLVPEVLKEVKATREAVPGMLDRADRLVINMRQVGKKASEGAVSGVITGIITAPFDLVGNIGKQLFTFSEQETKHLSEADIELAKSAAQDVLASNSLNYLKNWNNPESDAKGEVKLLEINASEELTCKVLNTKIIKNGKIILEKRIRACLDDAGNWQPD